MKKSLGAQTIAVPTPVWLIGSYDKDGKPNLATIAWGGVCCSVPPALTISLRKARHSYEAIMERKAFTVNVPSTSYIKEADYAGLCSGRDTDKFAAAGLTPVRSELVDAPYVSEFPLVLECRLIQTLDLGAHTQFIGEIVDVKGEESALNLVGELDAAKVQPIIYSPATRTYYGLGAEIGKGFQAGKDLLKKGE